MGSALPVRRRVARDRQDRLSRSLAACCAACRRDDANSQLQLPRLLGTEVSVNPTTGKTSGRIRRLMWSSAWNARGDVCKHCPHADKIRLRRVPRWVWFDTSRAEERAHRRSKWGSEMPRHRKTKREVRAWQHDAAHRSMDGGMYSIPF